MGFCSVVSGSNNKKKKYVGETSSIVRLVKEGYYPKRATGCHLSRNAQPEFIVYGKRRFGIESRF